MRFQISPKSSPSLITLEASTRGETSVAGGNRVGAWICEAVQGWYQRTSILETEPLAFAEGEVVVKQSSEGREIKVNLSKQQGISGDTENLSASIQRVFGINQKNTYVLRVVFTDMDKNRVSGTKEEVSDAYLVDAEIEVIGNFIEAELTFRTLNQGMTFETV